MMGFHNTPAPEVEEGHRSIHGTERPALITRQSDRPA